MKKIVFQVSLILLIIMIGSMSVLITNSNAESKAKLNCPSSVTLGENIKVSLDFPSNTYMGSANVQIKFSNGKIVSGNIVYQKGTADFVNYVVLSTSSASEGQATISVTDIKIGDGSTNNTKIENGGSLSSTINIIKQQSTTPPATTTPSTPSTSGSGTTTSNNASTNTENSNQTSNNSQAKYTDVNETVVITESNVNFRKEASTKSGTYGLLQTGTKLTRTAIGDNGWSKVTYNGKNGYVSSQYLKKESDNTTTTTNQDVKFKDVNEKMYASQNCNLRKSWSTDSDKVGYLNKGQEVTRNGVADNGWSRINYNGQVVYVATRLLTSTKPEEDENKNEVTNEVTNELTNEVTNETTNELTEEQKLAEIQEEVGVLPEVGNNIANNLYVIITVIAITLVSAGLYFHIKKSE